MRHPPCTKRATACHTNCIVSSNRSFGTKAIIELLSRSHCSVELKFARRILPANIWNGRLFCSTVRCVKSTGFHVFVAVSFATERFAMANFCVLCTDESSAVAAQVCCWCANMWFEKILKFFLFLYVKLIKFYDMIKSASILQCATNDWSPIWIKIEHQIKNIIL